jgi:hypothetical protein
VDPTVTARVLWLGTHPLPTVQDETAIKGATFDAAVGDEFTVPSCRGHHREVHRCGDEAAWWRNAGIDPIVLARAL